MLTPMYSFYTMTIDEVSYSYRFSFPIFTAFQDNNLIHDNLSMTFEDLVEYYSELPNNEVVFDIENKEIHLQGFSIFSQTKTEDYPIHITWNIDGYTVEMVREE